MFSSLRPLARRRAFSLVALAASAPTLALHPAAAAAPSPSQITPASLAPTRAPSSPEIHVGKPAPSAAPEGAQALRFRLRKVLFSGGFEEPGAAAEALAQPLEGREITVAQLYDLARAVEALYADSGYPLARVTVPPQQLRDGGDARLAVIDGYIEAADVAGVPEAARAVVSSHVEGLVGRHRLRRRDLERAVLLAGDLAGIRLRSSLGRGRSPGGVVLTLEADVRRVSASFGSDNNLPASLGTYEWNGRLAVNNALGMGEQSYLSFASGYAMGLNGFPMSPMRTIGLGVVAPIGANGFSLNPEVTQSLTRPKPAEAAPPSVGEFDRFALRGSFPIERTHDVTLTVNGAVEAINQELYGPLNGAAFSHDAYAAVRAGANWQGAAFWGATLQGDAQLSQGLGGREPSADVKLSREGAGEAFTKLSGGAHAQQSLGAEFRLDLSAHVQWAFGKPMLASEQFSLDGADAVSAFAQGAFNVDSGETVRVEASRPSTLPISAGALTLTPYLFAAQGYGRLHQPTALESGHIVAGAFGLGARLAFDGPDGFSGAGLGVELSRGVSSVASEKASKRAALNLNVHY